MTDALRINYNPDAPAVRPVDLPEIRNETARLLSDPRIQETWDSLAAKSPTRGNSADNLRKVFMRALREADQYWVAGPMAELTEAGAQSVPSFELQPEDVPSMSGLLIFEQPIAAVTSDLPGEDGRHVQVLMDGIVWTVVAGQNGKSAVAVYSLTMGRRHWYFPTDVYVLEYGSRVPDFGSLDYFRAVRAVWLLMRQQLAETEDVEPDRASRKRQCRAGYEPRPIRVINLRRPKGEGGAADGHNNYHHQWVVRGHWRNHWHPKRQVHRPVWIAPHVKGPEGAPMIGGEKVYAWKK